MTMVSPFEGRLTQNHAASGGYAGHKGMDIAPPKPGQNGLPVYAAFAGTVKKVYRSSKPGNKADTLAPGRTGNGVLIANPDGEGNLYNHVKPLASIKVNSKVEAGDLIGYNDASGNQSNEHLHFELWASWKDHDSDYDPKDAFDKFGVKPGSKPLIEAEVEIVRVASVKPSKAPQKAAEDHEDVQRKLAYMRLYFGAIDGKNGNRQKRAVKAFQKAHGLVADAVWGAKTEARYQWNKDLQDALKRTKGVPDNWKSDGFVGKTTKYWARYTMTRQGWGNLNNAQLETKLRAVKAWK